MKTHYNDYVDCCDKNGLNKIFRGNFVKHDERNFRKKGLEKRQKAFFQNLDLENKSILDIGCGIGALGIIALQKGGSHATFVEISKDYLTLAKNLVHSLDLESKASFYQNDILQLTLEPSNIVTLDRVVCCYQDAEKLLGKAARLSKDYLIFTYPNLNWFMKLGKAFVNFGMVVSRQPYRFYLHKETLLLNAATSFGHRIIHTEVQGPWRLCLCKKTN